MDSGGNVGRELDLPGVRALPPPPDGENMWGIRLCDKNPKPVIALYQETSQTLCAA